MKAAMCCGVEVLSETECRQIVDCKLKTNEAELIDVKTRPLSEARAGFLGDHYLVTITVSSKCQTIELHFFAKVSPTSAIHSDMVLKMKAYYKETHFYSVLMLHLMKYDEELNEDGGSVRPAWSCDCYLTTPSKIVLDDVSVQGYRNHGHHLFMDKEHCDLVLKTLARFHASSIVFEEKETQRTGEVCRLNEVHSDQFEESAWMTEKGNPTKMMYDAGIRANIELLKYLPDVMEDEGRHKDLAERMWESYEDHCALIRNPSKDLRYAVAHGDMWTNNILIRYEDEKPVDLKFVDFQILRYTAPAHDILAFLHVNTRRHMRDQHLLDFARTYHEALRTELTRHHLDVDSILSWDQFEASLEQYREMAAFTASFYFQLVHMDPDIAAEKMASEESFKKFIFENRVREVCYCFENDPMYKEVLTEGLEELIEYLDRRTK